MARIECFCTEPLHPPILRYSGQETPFKQVLAAATNHECEGLPQDEIVFTNVGCFQRVVGMQVVLVLDALLKSEAAYEDLTMVNNFQRLGSTSNSHVGRDFETAAQDYFRQKGISLQRGHSVQLGVSSKKKNRKFDLGSDDPPVLVECKSNTWTRSGNVPSAKMTVWNEAMYLFLLAPTRFQKVLFVLRDFNEGRSESLAEYYLRSYSHLIPGDVEIWEYDALASSIVNVTGTSDR